MIWHYFCILYVQAIISFIKLKPKLISQIYLLIVTSDVKWLCKLITIRHFNVKKKCERLPKVLQ